MNVLDLPDDEGDVAAVPGGGDAADILPAELLDRRLRRYETRGGASAPSARAVRGEFELLQRELSAKIPRFDRDCEIVHEDREAIVYALSKRKDLEYVLDYCEIDDRRIRRLVVELLGDIASSRAGNAPQHPLVVRKPASFRAGERHAIGRLSTFEDSSAVAAWIGRVLGIDTTDARGE